MSLNKKNKRISIKEIRRVELIEAAYRVFLDGGLSELTTSRICSEAGLSQGILTYYFKNKDEVLFEMVRYVNRLLMNEVIDRLVKADTYWDRMIAIIEGNFPEKRYEPNDANAWISFYAASASNTSYARLQTLFYKRLRSNLASALNGVLEPVALDHFTRGFASMIDGLWLRRGQDKDLYFTEAILLLTEYAENTLGSEIVNTLKFQQIKRYN